jgi:hypothetical protein
VGEPRFPTVKKEKKVEKKKLKKSFRESICRKAN